MDGIIVTPEHLATLHPLPGRLLPVVQNHLSSTNMICDESMYGLHILHVSLKDAIPSQHRRRKRSFHGGNSGEEDTDDETPRTCATGPEHDVTGHGVDKDHHRTPSRFRNLTELTGKIDIRSAQGDIQKQLKEGKKEPEEPEDKENNGPGTEEDQLSFLEEVNAVPGSHNHTVEAAPVAAIIRRTVELAVFSDESLYRTFPQRVDSSDKSKLVNYILTLVNAVQGIYHQEELEGYVLDLKIVRLDILTTGGPSNSGGDIGAYLTAFCSWQQRINPNNAAGHWDHAFMLSGLDLHSSGNPSVIGLAWVGGMCRPTLSCTMNEGRSFMAVNVVAHEMGHNLGMHHDGQGNARPCSSSKYIMSPSVGPGKTTWSSCSSQVIHKFLRKSTCLNDGNDAAAFAIVGARAAAGEQEELVSGQNRTENDHRPKLKTGMHEVDLENLLKKTPGYQFSLPMQCHAMFGRDYRPALTKFDLCDYLYCTNGVVTQPAHPALEGSFCGSHRICIAGKCRPEADLANLILYNLPSLAHLPTESSAATNGTSPISATSQTTTYSPSTPAFTNQPSTFLPVHGDECSCTVRSSSTLDMLANIPREICPFLAPVYHQLFRCSVECPSYDLHLDLTSGNLTQVLIESSALEEAVESCFFGSYTIVSDLDSQRSDTISIDNQGHVMNTGATSEDIRVPLEDPVACQGIPQFLHPSLHCPKTEALSQENCSPTKIILKTLGHNLTYTLESNGSISDKIDLKGKHYSLSRSAELDVDKESYIIFAPLTEEMQEEPHFGYIKCDLETSFPKILRDIPQEICPFLAPSLHKLFNCIQSSECPQYTVVVDQEDHTVKKIPMLPLQQQFPPCVCEQAELGVDTILSGIIQAVSTIVFESKLLCKLLPYSWLSKISGCDASAVVETVSENECPPTSLIIKAHNATFTYTLDLRNHNQPTIEWGGNTFALESINVNKTLADIYQDKFGVDHSSDLFKKEKSDIMEVQYAGDNKGSSTFKAPGHQLERTKSNSNLSNHSNGEGSLGTTFKPLQEYIGQNDVFLPLNAPEAMPRTKVGPCSVTCGKGTRLVQLECVDVRTGDLQSDDACQGYVITKQRMEPCHLPPCNHPRWSVGSWGECSEPCSVGVQYRSVECVIQITQDRSRESGSGGDGNNLFADPKLVVDHGQCSGKPPVNVQVCQGPCVSAPQCEDGEKCFTYADIQISKDFDY